MKPKANLRRTVIPLVGVILGMGAMAWAAIPLYNIFCRVTGYGGTTQEADVGSDTVLDQTVTVRFDGSTVRGMPWEFKPVKTTMTLRIGETGLAFFEAHNPTDRAITGQASYNVSPLSVGAYFVKIDCFCFTKQVLAPGETALMPVTFYVDPDIVNDPETAKIDEITLSYTFFELDASPRAERDGAAYDNPNRG